MNKGLVKKLILEAYIAGSEAVHCGCYPRLTKADARDWYDQEFGIEDLENHTSIDDEDS
jgi:hypothetical protein